jgi:hypothetical protein
MASREKTAVEEDADLQPDKKKMRKSNNFKLSMSLEDFCAEALTNNVMLMRYKRRLHLDRLQTLEDFASACYLADKSVVHTRYPELISYDGFKKGNYTWCILTCSYGVHTA